MSATTVILGVLVGAACIALLIGMRGHRPQGPGPAPATAADPHYLRLPCHSLICGHMTTRHMPSNDGTGTAICRECGSIRTETP